ncbi:MAG: 50S ribosomal protein L5 [Candidatus Babeliales bacterium]
MKKPRLEELYVTEVRPALKKQLKLKNIMQVPKISKIVLNVGVKEAINDNKILSLVANTIALIAGQRPVKKLARKSIAGFKMRKGMPIGVMVTLRRKKMYEFLDRLISLALPKVRDFQGLSSRFDGHGNYNLGIKDWIVFPEVEYDVGKKIYGCNITIQTTAKNDEEGRALLESFNAPFKKT